MKWLPSSDMTDAVRCITHTPMRRAIWSTSPQAKQKLYCFKVISQDGSVFYETRKRQFHRLIVVVFFFLRHREEWRMAGELSLKGITLDTSSHINMTSKTGNENNIIFKQAFVIIYFTAFHSYFTTRSCMTFAHARTHRAIPILYNQRHAMRWKATSQPKIKKGTILSLFLATKNVTTKKPRSIIFHFSKGM